MMNRMTITLFVLTFLTVILFRTGSATAQTNTKTISCYPAEGDNEPINAKLLADITTCLEQKINAAQALTTLVRQENQDLRESMRDSMNSLRFIWGTTYCRSVAFPSPYMVIVDTAVENPKSSISQFDQVSADATSSTSISFEFNNEEPSSYRSNIDCNYDSSGDGYLDADSMSSLKAAVDRICDRANWTVVQRNVTYVFRDVIENFWYGSARSTFNRNQTRQVQVGVGLNFTCKIT